MNMGHSKRDEQNRRDTILVVILIFVCVALFGVGTLISGDINKVSILSNVGGSGFQTNQESTPTPSPSPQPTKTPIPTRPTKKIKETDALSKNTTPAEGLGVSLEEIQNLYKKEGFQFSDTKTDNDHIHSLGKTSTGLTAIELNGTVEDIRDAAVVSYLAADTPEQIKDCLYYMAQLIKTVLPTWKDGTKWLYANIGLLPTMKTKPQEIETVYMSVRIILKKIDAPSVIILSMEPAPVK